jgi:tRNA uridine 5-carboxymethylaminomethyl modification enzyme
MQVDFIASIKGLEKAKIEQFGYAIEYDFVDPRDVKNTLETKNVRGLFLAGQVIGTTGYEEAAGLGLVAGANAALSIDGGEFVLPRYNSYIGVMIDDLTTLGVAGEPYRLFTSRSEYRLSCRSDNADFRLTEIGDEVGLIDVKRRVAFSSKKGEFERILNLLNELTITPSALQKFDVQITQDGVRRTAFEVLQYKDVTMNDLRRVWGEIPQLSSEMELLVTTEAKYSQYIERQKSEIDEIKKGYAMKIPDGFDFNVVQSLSAEIKEKLKKARPQSVGSAANISGVTPAALLALIVYLKKN